MSIIHDALKKVQQGLSSKNEATEVTPPKTDKNASAYIYSDPPPAVENLAPSAPTTANQKPPIQNKIKSILAFICALAITAGSLFYIYKEFQNYIPRAQRFAKKSFYQLIHKEEVPDFKTRAPEDLKPMAQLTIPAKASSPVTLNIHGIMANASGNLVLIDDQVYQEGDEVDGAKIVKINLDSITVIINGIEQTIPVKN